MKTRALLLAVLAACGGQPPSDASFTLQVPATLKAAPGATAFLDVKSDRADVTLTATSELGVTVTGLRVAIDVPRGATGKHAVKLTGTSRGETAEATVELAVLPAVQSPTGALSASVTLDSLFYAPGAKAKVHVDFAGATPSPLPDVILVSSESRDVEIFKLGAGGDSTELTVSTESGAATINDGTLTLPAGGLFFALLAVDGTSIASDFAFLDGARVGNPKSRVEPGLKLTADEDVVPEGGRPVGTLLRTGTGAGRGMPVQIATEELILFHADDAELQRFLVASQGELLVTETVEGDKPFASLVKVDPTKLNPDRLALLRGLLEDPGELVASKSDIEGIYGLALAYRLDGFIVAVNPRLAYQSVPAPNESPALTQSLQMRGRMGSSAACVPGDVSRRCAADAPALWAYLDLMDLDSQRIKVAVLDMGFAPNSDFRTNLDGGIDQCDVTRRPMRCGAGAALGPPTVGASLIGDRLWHGTGVVTTLGGIVDNGHHAGTGGQVAVPMLYKYDLASYAFDMGAGITHAVDHGAQVINISAGYPCTAVMNVGPDLDYCSVEGRVGICAIVTAAAHAAALAFCLSPAVGIPIVGPIACGALETAAVVATVACLSTIALGNVRAPMQSAVRYATSHGVPVVASAGNVLPPEAFPEPVRALIDLSEQRTEVWGIIPATIPDVIAAGAARTDNLTNDQFFGSRVDLWAPEPTGFMSPRDPADAASPLEDFSINATSAAAPYISGVIAAMQAANPSLDPARASPGERASAVSRVRAMLTSSAMTNAQLVALGWPSDPRRRNLIDPLGAVLAAASGVQPDLFDVHLNFDEADFADDTEAGARPIAFDTAVPGTVLAFESSGAVDRDWKTFTVPTLAGRVFGSDITLRWVGLDEPVLTSSGVAIPRVSASVGTATYRVVRASGSTVAFAITTRGVSEDASYQVTVSAPAALAPTMAIVSPVVPAGATVCANRPVTFTATATYPFSALTPSSIEWLIDGVLQAPTTYSTSFNRAPGTYTFTARAFGASANLTVTFATCAATAEILTPAANVMQYAGAIDAVGPYLTINFSGRATDAVGNVIDPATLVFEWTTNRGELQPGAPASGTQLLGTGASLSGIRIYCAGGSVGETHVITLTVRATAGGPVLSTDSILVTVQNLI